MVPRHRQWVLRGLAVRLAHVAISRRTRLPALVQRTGAKVQGCAADPQAWLQALAGVWLPMNFEVMNGFQELYKTIAHKMVLNAWEVDTGHWQGLKDVPQTKTFELPYVNILWHKVPDSQGALEREVKPNMPWAEDHFIERVGGRPLNPGEQYKNWPWFAGNVPVHMGITEPWVSETDWAYVAGVVMGEGTIDNSKGKPRLHIYQKDREFLEDIRRRIKVGRISCREQTSQLKSNGPICVLCVTNKQEIEWVLTHLLPYLSGEKRVKAGQGLILISDRPDHGNEKDLISEPRFSHTYMTRYWPKGLSTGIEFTPGDLMDIARLLVREPYTRQAYLPVWFPEDTGAVEEQRVPCSLGYHFMLRDFKLHVS